ncbi:peptide ABC transporter substrate-binding protein [Virgibacillus halodenitrificans]|uniref:peptide ABC transporter substrate-binding protein n=1 Tax=Virgibacillus halodenitrificans TaxID=1482 RepID=UPI0002ECF17E|nr:peptide ABC transporter substrate-binding protein [Virgibacillus halodenitrificans]MCG1028200.1 peptide ABC transporter substrate-binding protein [Virgibacillus halodenitrificans]MCJ0929567.1 peptide ABC transporter substrate-binding protein [Virgibacillus halodenitrificans]CDQ31533.1 Dipeptide-binding protein DppE precursor [Virgibacillus halodenitrificans]
MRKWLVVLMAILTVLMLAACTANEDAGEEKPKEDGNDAEATEEKSDDGKVLYMNNGSEPTSLNPPVGFDSVSWNVLNNLMEGLTRLGEDDQPQEAIAESWDISEDQKTYTFHIRENANWSNGDPVTAEDFVYAWKQLLNPETASPAAFLGYFIEGGEAYNNGEGSADDVGVKAVDEKTFEVTLNAPTGFFLHVISNPAFFPVNAKVAEENPEWYAEADSFVSNGPFKLESWAHDSEMMMVKNDQYWDAETVKLDKVHWAMVNETNTEYQMFESGDLDMTSIPSDMADQLIDGDNVVIEDQAGLYFYRFNVNEEPFQNEKIRKAFALAINQQDIVDFVTKNKEEPATGFVSPGFKDPSGKDFREVNGDLVKFDPEKAKKLLEEGMKEEGYDELPEVVLSYNTSEDHKAIAETMQSMYKDNLGVEVSLENTEWNVFLEDQKGLKHQLSRSSFLFDYGDPVNFLESFITDSTMNRTGWSNKEYDELIANAKSETDEAKRWEYMEKAEKLLAEKMPIFPIHYYNQVFIYSEDVSGIVRHPVGYVELKWADKQ